MKFRVAGDTRFGHRRLVYARPDGFSWRRGARGRAWMSAHDAKRAKQWARRRRATQVRVYQAGQFPFLDLSPGAAWPTNRRLLRLLNVVGQRRARMVLIISGLRTPHEAWVLRMRWLDRKGNLAARCCSRYEGKHSWEQCGKDPWSNHADGNAADCGTVSGRGRYVSLADDAKARRIADKVGLGFPVVDPWEPWHVELRRTK